MAGRDLSQDVGNIMASFATNEAALLRRIEALERGREFDRTYPMIMQPGANILNDTLSLWACDPRVVLYVDIMHFAHRSNPTDAQDAASLAAAIDAFHATRPHLPKVVDEAGVEKVTEYRSPSFAVSAGLLREFIRTHNVWEYLPHSRDRQGMEVNISVSYAPHHAGPLQDASVGWWLQILKEELSPFMRGRWGNL